MNRRDFLKLTSLLGMAGTGLFPYHPALATQDRTILPIPPLLHPDAQGNINLTLQEGSSQFINGKRTKTWGINQAFLGPALILDVNQKISVTINNQLPDPTTLHWHGLIIPGSSDGGPQDLIPSKQSQTVHFILQQPASTCWVHPHLHGQTGKQVTMGLAGLVLIQDEQSKKLPLPTNWGKDDIPVILQDRQFNTQGQFEYKLDIMSAALGWFGNHMLTNGASYPRHIAPKGWLRLRFLNGCNARTLNLATSDGRPFYVIASDGGFLPQPVQLDHLPLWMGERFEVLVNTSDGKAFDIITTPTNQMGMTLAPFNQAVPVLTIQPSSESHHTKLPDHLMNISVIPELSHIPERKLHLMMNPKLDILGMQAFSNRYGQHSMHHMDMAHDMHSVSQHSDQPFNFHAGNMINGVPYHMNQPLFNVKQGQYERWVISGKGDMMVHPFHIHGTQFRILSENDAPPAPHRAGWKDVVHVEGKTSEVLVKFDHLADQKRAYMAHCHLLEHEDTGMMCGFTVSA
ncbi:MULTISPECIES: multicopper oxidase CueO [Commensalibacter]|uniref:Multicopper oxidase n=2 Tax=Commensalibacter TaxID=1079922 RepID=W7E4D7_9PROT|nr:MULTISPECIES: multicopper oxidase CueO [Commensalibacter]EUK17951.1 multicopper oxidase [Commensalibacter papalotli (ex Servin-Garciduenas et al. 2014)]CAI3941261.1 Multicopper oxidase with three cupredoxin domains (includes cell division protein FtsP and spore coat protein CotA) (SufI) (PDB:2YXV) [Commensalibacter papalotli (ex Botero et al. 2024)]CAI3949746.1 Multicopper oxidase with three cupredoxin domains (includes cell division protein FtsP and spore coat protein CotA) (SufI) (PDB:2YXV)